MATNIELQEELKKLNPNVELTGDEKNRELVAMLAEEKQKIGKPEKNNLPENPGEKNNFEKDKIVYVWVKVKSYVDKSGMVRMGTGLFKFTEKEFKEYPRLSIAKQTSVEVFYGEIPSMKLAKIGRWAGVNVDNHRNDKELLQLLISVPHIVTSIK